MTNDRLIAGHKYSCFVLNEDGTWLQPTYMLASDMDEAEFSVCVLSEFGHHYFLAVGICEDEACPDDDARTFA